MAQKINWKQVKTSSQTHQRPSPRWGHSSCVVNDQIILFGGYANSVYMNDMWTFNTVTMEWKEVNTTGQKPSCRSNCSLNYDQLNKRLVIFGGGGQNKRRFNQINLLNWETKEWTNISFEENETAPWERTYHSAQLLFPYLIIYGGQGIADLDDLWVYNFQNNKWMEVTFSVGAVRPCGRRFHTSCLIGNEFFVIAGCYSKYRPLNDIYSIDLTKLIQTGSVQNLQWKLRVTNQLSYLTRWGQSTAVKGNNIYIFGGRFSNDLNDMLIFNAESNKIRSLKVTTESLPKPRRRSSLNFIGNCLLMFGGFNSDYYNDLHYINVTQNYPKLSKKNDMNIKNIESLIYEKQLADLQIRASNGKVFYCHKGILMQSMKFEQTLKRFIRQIQGKEQEKQLQQLLLCLYKGYGGCKILDKYLIEIPKDLEEKQLQFNKHMDQFRKPNVTQAINDTDKSSNKAQIVIQLQESEYKNYIQNFQQNCYKDLVLQINQESNINKEQVVASNKIMLYANCKFFKNILSNNKNKDNLKITVSCGGVDKLKIVNNYLMTGHLVVPVMSYKSWIELYNLGDYLGLVNLENLIVSQMYSMINESSFGEIFEFAEENRLRDLAVSCIRYKLSKNCKKQSKINENNKYYKIGYQQNRFEIDQQLMIKNPPLVFKNKNSNVQNMEDQKQNATQTCQN